MPSSKVKRATNHVQGREKEMMKNEIVHPERVGQDKWLTARETLPEHEKEATKHRDRINTERHRLPMVKLEKAYTFEGSMALST